MGKNLEFFLLRPLQKRVHDNDFKTSSTYFIINHTKMSRELPRITGELQNNVKLVEIPLRVNWKMQQIVFPGNQNGGQNV